METPKLHSFILADDGSDTRNDKLLDWFRGFWKFAPLLAISTEGSTVLDTSSAHS
jgi:hypothetical protein